MLSQVIILLAKREGCSCGETPDKDEALLKCDGPNTWRVTRRNLTKKGRIANSRAKHLAILPSPT
jgi:hypothetical protein